MTDKIFELIGKETERINESINLIASENYASSNVLSALGSVLSSKYSEGYPSKRYYAGNIVIDEIENTAIERAKKLFGAEHVNVQPYSGSPANIEVYNALINNGDKILSLSLSQGGHLTHGHKVSFSGKNYTIVNYSVNKDTFMLDYEEIRRLAIEEKPQIIVSGATAYPRTIDFKKFQEIAEEVGAIHLADISHIAGLVAAGLHPSPFPFTDVVMTTTHKTLRGPRGAMILCKQKFAEKIDKSVFPGMQGGPHNNTTAAIAIALDEASSSEFKEYATQIIRNAKALSEELRLEGFNVVTGGTDNHLMLVDMSNTGYSGKQVEEILDSINITVNRNMVPYDSRSPLDPSGIRIGTPAMTTRGMLEDDMRSVARLISRAIFTKEDLSVLRDEVVSLAKKFSYIDDKIDVETINVEDVQDVDVDDAQEVIIEPDIILDVVIEEVPQIEIETIAIEEISQIDAADMVEEAMIEAEKIEEIIVEAKIEEMINEITKIEDVNNEIINSVNSPIVRGTILDGKKIADDILDHISKYIRQKGMTLRLAVVLAGVNLASELYVRNKKRKCESLGITFDVFRIDSNEEKLLSKISELNNDESVDGILIQLPLPKNLNTQKIVDTILPSKDVDGITTYNMQQLELGNENILCCTPKGILTLLEVYGIDLNEKNIVLLGMGNLVGKPLSMMLNNRGIKHIACDINTANIDEKLLRADILISATGVANLVKEHMVKDGAVVIDAGTSDLNGTVAGDVDFKTVSKKASYITPVPGGIGPMTIAMLIDNLLIIKHNKLANQNDINQNDIDKRDINEYI